MKRFVAMLLALLLLVSGVAMTEDELSLVVQRLGGYLDMLQASERRGVDTISLEECVEALQEMKNRKKKPLELYFCALSRIGLSEPTMTCSCCARRAWQSPLRKTS